MVGNAGESIENGALIIGASSASACALQFWIITRWPSSTNRWIGTLPNASAPGAIAPPVSMKRAVTANVAGVIGELAEPSIRSGFGVSSTGSPASISGGPTLAMVTGNVAFAAPTRISPSAIVVGFAYKVAVVPVQVAAIAIGGLANV